MREIKFRAWDKDKKWMVYDVQDAYDGLWSERNSDEINDYYSYVSTFQSFTDEESFNFMQYTGLKDKNGTEIYEGDILQDKRKRKFKVTWNNDIGSWVNSPREDSKSYPCFNIGTVKGLEVVGNIYETPELCDKDRGCI